MRAWYAASERVMIQHEDARKEEFERWLAARNARGPSRATTARRSRSR